MHRRSLLGVACFIVVLLSGCANARAPIRIGVNPWPPCEIWYAAQQQGYFNGLPVQIVRFSTWTDNMAALCKGNIDLTHSSYFNSVYYSDKGEKGRIILISDTLLGGDGLAVKRSIQNGAELKGKRIAVEVNTDEHFLLRKALASFKLDESDVTIRSCTSEEARDLFLSNSVDACFTYEPYLSEAASRGNGRVLWTTQDAPGYMVDVLVARDQVVQKRAADLRTVIGGWYRAQEYLRGHASEAYAALAANEGMSGVDFRSFFESFTFFSAEDNRRILGSADFHGKLGEMRDFLLSHKAVSADVNVDSVSTADIAAGIR